MNAIYKREIKAYFTSIPAYIYLALSTAVTAIFYTIICVNYGYNDFASYIMNNSLFMLFMFVLVTPILTMRLFSEEKKNKTDQLLLTAPVRPSAIVFGKFFAVLTIFGISILLISIFPCITTFFGKVPLKNTISGYCGYILFAIVLLAIGMFISSMTENQIVSIIVSAVIGLLVLIGDSITTIIPSGKLSTWIGIVLLILAIAILFLFDTRHWLPSALVIVVGALISSILFLIVPSWFDYGIGNVLDWISLTQRYQEFTNGIMNLSSITYLLSVAILFVYLTIRVIEKRRWR